MSQDLHKMVSSLNIYWSPAVDEGRLLEFKLHQEMLFQ